MAEAPTRITVDKRVPGYWRVTLHYPPINTTDEQMCDELFDLAEAIDADQSLKVATFDSGNPDFFLAHYGIAPAGHCNYRAYKLTSAGLSSLT